MTPPMNDQDLRDLIQAEVDAHRPATSNVQDVVRTAVHETLTSLGMDVADPLELQRDLAFVRDLRRASDTVKTRGILILVGLVVSALAGAAWLGFKASINS